MISCFQYLIGEQQAGTPTVKHSPGIQTQRGAAGQELKRQTQLIPMWVRTTGHQPQHPHGASGMKETSATVMSMATTLDPGPGFSFVVLIRRNNRQAKCQPLSPCAKETAIPGSVILAYLPFPRNNLVMESQTGSTEEGFRDHIVLRFHFADGKTESQRVEGASLRFQLMTE